MRQFIVLLFFIFIGSAKLYAQSLVFPGSVWYHAVFESFWNNNIAYIQTVRAGDTLIGLDTFHILRPTVHRWNLQTWSKKPLYLRSDSDRVFSWYPELDTVYMMYDLSAIVGASWFVKYYHEDGSLIDDRFTLVSKDSVIMNGRVLRRIEIADNISHQYPSVAKYFTERLGTGGYILPMPSVPDGPTIMRNCYYDYNWPLTKELGFDCVHLHVSNDEYKESYLPVNFIQIAPFKWRLDLPSNQDLTGSVEIYDVSGRRLNKSDGVSSSIEFELPVAGIYLWRYVSTAGVKLAGGRILNR